VRFRREKRLKVHAAIDMAPLVAALFQLLLFFILGSTFAVHTTLNFEYAKAPGPVSYEQKDLSVTLTYEEDGESRIFVNDEAVASLGELGRVLAEARSVRPNLLLLLRPDARVPSSRLIEILGLAQSVGIDRYQVAAQPAGEPATGTP